MRDVAFRQAQDVARPETIFVYSSNTIYYKVFLKQ